MGLVLEPSSPSSDPSGRELEVFPDFFEISAVELLIRISGISATRGGGCARGELGSALETSSSSEKEKSSRFFSRWNSILGGKNRAKVGAPKVRGLHGTPSAD